MDEIDNKVCEEYDSKSCDLPEIFNSDFYNKAVACNEDLNDKKINSVEINEHEIFKEKKTLAVEDVYMLVDEKIEQHERNKEIASLFNETQYKGMNETVEKTKEKKAKGQKAKREKDTDKFIPIEDDSIQYYKSMTYSGHKQLSIGKRVYISVRNTFTSILEKTASIAVTLFVCLVIYIIVNPDGNLPSYLNGFRDVVLDTTPKITELISNIYKTLKGNGS